jgi:predicted ATPase
LHPLIEQLERAARFERDDPPDAKLNKLEALLALGTKKVDQAVPLVAAVLGLQTNGRYALPEVSPQRQKQLTLAALVEQLEGLAAEQPVLLAYEDVHWIDPTTQELLGLTIERIRSLPVLAIITFRPEFSPPWSGQPHMSTLALTRLGRRDGAALVDRVIGAKPLPVEVSAQIVEKTDGVPLFVEELTKTVLESGLLKDAGDRWELSGPLRPLHRHLSLRSIIGRWRCLSCRQRCLCLVIPTRHAREAAKRWHMPESWRIPTPLLWSSPAPATSIASRATGRQF